MDENELSYLDDIKAQPDFLDDAPHVPSNEVNFHHNRLVRSSLDCYPFQLLAQPQATRAAV